MAGATAAARGSSVAAHLYLRFIYGGSSSVEDASAGASDFTEHATTIYVTKKILGDALARLRHGREHLFFPLLNNPQTHIDLQLNQAQISGVDDQSSDYALNFCGLNLPGVIAGGIGKTQTAAGNLGADTSAQRNDSRTVGGSLRVTPDRQGPAQVRLTVVPNLTYSVVDTVDFCPGNSGGALAQTLTVPLSRWEASGISGDVTFRLEFPAPAVTAGITLEWVNGTITARDPSIEGP